MSFSHITLSGHFKDDAFFVEQISEVRQPKASRVAREAVDESEVDNECKANLVAIGFDKDELPFRKTHVASIDACIPSKSASGAGKGKFDVCIMAGGMLRAVVENKAPGISVDVALAEAKAYCEGLQAAAVDVRIAIGYNGKEIKWSVLTGRDPASGKFIWSPFYINGVESRSFPTPELVSLVYCHNGVSRIVEDRSQSSKKALERCINSLRQKYRQLFFIQNDNHTTIDFTIAFIGLKSILEKHGDLLPNAGWKWNGLPGAVGAEGVGAHTLKTNIMSCVSHICDVENRASDAKERGCIDLAKNFRDIFYQTSKSYKFEFPKLIADFRTAEQLEALKFIYTQIAALPALHSSRIDLFGETYELLADKNTKQAFGQFFTGRHIIRPLIRLLLETETAESITGGIDDRRAINPKKFCDPACGTGGFLTESFKHVRDIFANQPDQPVDVNAFAQQAFFGYDISPANVTKTKINLYLAGDGFSELETLNSLTGKVAHQFDYIITNPPYGAGDVLVDAKVIGSNRLEVNFLVRIVNLLKPGSGKALLVLPDGIFESPSLAPLREWLMKQCVIDKIVGLPKFAFAPYTKEKTYALYLTKRAKPLSSLDQVLQNKERMWCYIVDNDGYANSDKRFPTARQGADGRWLHDEFSEWVDAHGIVHECALIERWKDPEPDASAVFKDEWGTVIPGRKFGHVRLADVLRQEFTSYAAVSKTDALKLVTRALTPKPGAITDAQYEAHGLVIGPDAKGKRTIAAADGRVLTESGAYKAVLVGLKATGALPSKTEQLFEADGSLKPRFAEILLGHSVAWDEADQAFSNQGVQTVTKLLNLLPEKYFREEKVERILVDDLASEIDKLDTDFKALVAGLMHDTGVPA